MDTGTIITLSFVGIIAIIILISTISGSIERITESKRRNYEELSKAVENEKQKLLSREQLLNEAESDVKSRKDYYNKIIKDFDNIIKEKCHYYPQLAVIMADILTLYYERSAKYLENKPHPAYEEARRIRDLRKDTQKTLKDKKELEYRFAYILELFPNITDIFDKDFDDNDAENMLNVDNIDEVRYYITDEEYKALPTSERNQLALENYLKKRKSKWQLGRDYEMYVGYLYEKQGYKIQYNGILKGLEDLGRDVIATKGKEVVIIQCKRWAQEKTIHEKHIFQLYGTVVLSQIDNCNARGLFATTTSLSGKAKEVAKFLKIEVKEQFPLGDFPRIKCNVNRDTGEKIYHLPFDQQYDRVIIEQGKGEMLAFTVKEAEGKGFRRAYKHCYKD